MRQTFEQSRKSGTSERDDVSNVATPRLFAIINLGRIRTGWGSLLAALVVVAATGAPAATRTWNGGGDGTTWSTGNASTVRNNWGGTAFATGDDVIFSGTAGTNGPSIGGTSLTVGSITFTNAGSFTISGTAALTINSGVTNNDDSTQTFTVSTITLGASQTWNSGTLAGGSLVFSGTTLNLGASQTLTIDGANNTRIANNITGSGSSGIIKNGSGVLTLGGANTFTGAATVNAGTLVLTNGSALADSVVVTLSTSGAALIVTNSETIGSLIGVAGTTVGIASGQTLTTGGNNNSSTNAGVIAGAGSLTKAGTGTMTLSGANTFSGGLTLSAGTLVLTNGSALADALAVNLTASGASLLVTNSETIGSLIGVAGTTVGIASGQTLTTGGNNNSSTNAGVIAGAGSLTKAGTGIMTLSGANTFTGSATVNAGTLVLTNGSALADTVAVNVAASGAALIVTNSETLGSLASVAGAVVGIASGQTLTVGVNNTSTTNAGVISGAGDLTKTGTGTMTMSASNTFTGQTVLLGGTLLLGTNGALGTGTSSLLLGATSGNTNATLQLAAGVTNSRNGVVRSGSTGVLAIKLLNAGTSGLDGTWQVDGSVAFETASGASLQFNNTISGAGGITKTGAGSVSLNATNSFAGNATINDGLLFNGIANGMPTSAIVTVTNTGRYDLAGFAQTLVGIEGNGAVTNSGATATLTLNQSGTASYLGTFDGGLNLIKNGAGTLTLAGLTPGTASGSVTVNNGTLSPAQDGVFANVSSITLNTGGTLLLAGSGTNRINNAAGLTLNGGTLDLNGRTEFIGSLTLDGNSTIDFGTTFGSKTILNFTNGTWLSGIVTILNWSSSQAGGGIDELQAMALLSDDFLNHIQFDGFPLGAVLLNFNDHYEIVPVPEPATWLAAGAALSLIAWRERRRLVSLLRRA